MASFVAIFHKLAFAQDIGVVCMQGNHQTTAGRAVFRTFVPVNWPELCLMASKNDPVYLF